MVTEKDTDFVDYSSRAYVPQAFGLWLGRALGISFRKTIWLGKFFNLLVYALVLSAAIKYAKVGKRALLCVAFLPTAVFLACVYSYDASVTAFLMLGLVLILDEIVDGEPGLNWKRVTAGVLAMLFGSFPKAVYIPLLLLSCFIPKEKFQSKIQRRLFLLAVVLIFLVMVSSFALEPLANAARNIDVGGDARGGDTSVTRQMRYIMGAPLAYAGLLFKCITESFGRYFLGEANRANFAYLGYNSGNLYFLSEVLMIFVAVTGEKRVMLGRRLKIIIGILLAGVVALVWTALYLSFTPVGANAINGVQPRYYIPLTFPVMLLFSSDKIKCSVDGLWYDRMLILANLAVLAGCIYRLILLPYCC